MKWVLVAIILTIFLTGCGVEFGQNYKHLQEQDPTGLRRVDLNDGTNKNVNEQVKDDKGLYEYLGSNLCEIKPECCGDLTDDQKDWRDLEKRAVVEKNIALCYEIPDEPFVIDCGNDFEEIIVLYNKSRCVASLQEEAR